MRFFRSGRAALGVIAGVALAFGAAPGAQADGAETLANNPPFPDGSSQEVIENAGSDTTFFVVCDMAQKYHSNSPAGVNPGGANANYARCDRGVDRGSVDSDVDSIVRTSTAPPLCRDDFIEDNDTDGDPDTVEVAGDAVDASGHTYAVPANGGICLSAPPSITNAPCTSAGAYVSGGTYETADGSSNGRTELSNCDNTAGGPVDFSRSSADPLTSVPADKEFQFFAFALDGLSWGRWKNACTDLIDGVDNAPAGCSPNNLTRAQLISIYSGCTSGVTDWSQVGGDNAPIKLFGIQTGSGTRSFFDGRLLGSGVTMSTCPTTPLLQEHDATGVPAADKSQAIYGYSIARWNTQKSGAEADKRNGIVLGAVNGVLPGPTTLTEDSALQPNATACNVGGVPGGSFCGTRYVGNYVDTPGPGGDLTYGPSDRNASYEAAINFVGVRIRAGADKLGAVCSGRYKRDIAANGFVPLVKSNRAGVDVVDVANSCFVPNYTGFQLADVIAVNG